MASPLSPFHLMRSAIVIGVTFVLLVGCQTVKEGSTAFPADTSSRASSTTVTTQSSSSSQSVTWKTYSNAAQGFSFSYPAEAFESSLTFDAPPLSTQLEVVEDSAYHQVFLTPVKLGFANKDTQSMRIVPATLSTLRSYAADTGIWTIHYISVASDAGLNGFLKNQFPFESSLGARWKKTPASQEGVFQLSMEYDCVRNPGDVDTSVCPLNTDYNFFYRPGRQQLIWWQWNYLYGDPRFWKTPDYQSTNIDYSRSFDREIVESFMLL